MPPLFKRGKIKFNESSVKSLNQNLGNKMNMYYEIISNSCLLIDDGK